MTPQTVKGASFKKHRGPYPRTVMDSVSFDIKNNRSIHLFFFQSNLIRQARRKDSIFLGIFLELDKTNGHLE